MIKYVRSFWRRLRFRPAQPTKATIEFDAQGFSVLEPSAASASEARLAWSAVQQVVAYKRDCFALDLLCLAMELEGPRTLELNEEMQGWQLFIETLPLYLEGCPAWTEWWQQVTSPPFATNATVLFQRGSSLPITGVV
jgi:hypothetical protein